ncbi:MAG TPA: hypothetical protein VGL37_04360 [Solirubrobacteraceae bacterium]|jgi:hypothetical protein
MSGAQTGRIGAAPLYARIKGLDRVDVATHGTFLLMVLFYIWIAATSLPLGLHNGQADPYNLLTRAFLHFHLWIAQAPSELQHLANPYEPAQNAKVTAEYAIHDFVLYKGRLYLTWGPAPAIVLLVPMHLLGLAPSPSFTVLIFSVVGLGFALAALRVLLRKVGDPPLWMCTLSALALAISSIVPFLLRRPAVYEEAIAGGYCFAMIGIWLALSAVSARRASLRRLALMSLCFGLAAGSRPTLGLLAVLLVPVYLAIRGTRARRGLLLALLAPIGICFVLLLAYNEARFGGLLEVGVKYQLAGYNPQTTQFASLRYLLPGLWFYGVNPPHPNILFPFITLGPPPLLYPLQLPADYVKPEITGGLLPMEPIVLLLFAAPWVWRRRRAPLGSLALPLLLLPCIGLAIMLFVSYQIPSATERYAADFSTLFMFGALAVWLALYARTHGTRRRLLSIAGAILLTWGCIVGVAVSFVGYSNRLAIANPGTWKTLQQAFSPFSTALASAAGHPILAEAEGLTFHQTAMPGYGSLGATVKLGWIFQNENAHLTIVSPDTRTATLQGTVTPGYLPSGGVRIVLGAGASALLIKDPGHPSSTYSVPGGGGAFVIPVQLKPGLNHLTLRPLSNTSQRGARVPPGARQLLVFKNLTLAAG